MNIIQSHLNMITELATIIFIGFLVLYIIDYFDRETRKRLLAKDEKNTRFLSFMPILNKLCKIIVLFIILAIILQNHGISIASLIAGFGITGLAVGFAAKETISNVFGSLAILYDRVYDIGDYVVTDLVEGTVMDINLRSTRFKGLDNTITSIPNNIMANTVVRNVTAIDKRLIDETISITYETSDESIEKAIFIIENILKNNSDINNNDVSVYLNKLDNSSINIRAIAYINYADVQNLRRIKQEFFKEIIKQFRKEEIVFAFPSQTLYLKN